MRRIVSILLSFALLCSVSACSEAQTQPLPDTPHIQTQPEQEHTGNPINPSDIIEPTESPSETDSPAQLTVLIGSAGLSEWSEGVPLCTSNWQTLALDTEDARRYPALADSLRKLNEESAEWGASFMTDNLPYAQELLHDRNEFFYGLTYSDEYTVQRADEVILSIRGEQSDYTGGVHPNYGVYGLNLNPKTGKRVQLSEILTTTEGLPDILADKILAKYPDEPFPSLQEMLADYREEDYSWTVNYQGLTFYFSPYEIASYAAGLLTVTIWFDEAPELFREEYLNAPETGYAMALPIGYPVELDLDPADNVRDEISITFLTDEYDIMRPTLICNDVRLYDEEYYCYQMWPYLVRTQGKNYIYLEGTMENDYRTLNIYALNSGEIRLVGRIEGSGFHSVWYENEGQWGTSRTEVFTAPGHFVLDTRLDMLGTMTGTNLYHVNAADGMPVKEQPFYTLPEDRSPLTTLVSLEVNILPDLTPETLEPGTQLWFLRTDGRDYVDMLLADGRECRVTVESGPEGWERYINGIAEWDCFDGLLYAG